VKNRGDHDGTPSYPIESVDNALRLLLLLRDQDRVGVSEAGRALGVARSTAHRLLAMLQYHGFVVREASSRAYLAGPALVDLGLSAIRQLDVRVQARAHIERLASEVGETVHLGLLRGTQVVFLDSVETPRALRVGSRAGEAMPAHCTALGKAMLAGLTHEQLVELYPGGRLERLTERSVSTRAQLERELRAVRDRGYATNAGESERDIVAVAMAVGGGGERRAAPRAAVAISAPITRWDAGDVTALLEPLARCVRAIEASVG